MEKKKGKKNRHSKALQDVWPQGVKNHFKKYPLLT